jgi:hypothetical protein
LKHSASRAFWTLYLVLPAEVRTIADKNFALMKENPHHPSLRLKKIGLLWSARVGEKYRALGHGVDGGVHWFWIGSHNDYDRLISR